MNNFPPSIVSGWKFVDIFTRSIHDDELLHGSYYSHRPPDVHRSIFQSPTTENLIERLRRPCIKAWTPGIVSHAGTFGKMAVGERTTFQTNPSEKWRDCLMAFPVPASVGSVELIERGSKSVG